MEKTYALTILGQKHGARRYNASACAENGLQPYLAAATQVTVLLLQPAVHLKDALRFFGLVRQFCRHLLILSHGALHGVVQLVLGRKQDRLHARARTQSTLI